jgi:hypothetical protein
VSNEDTSYVGTIRACEHNLTETRLILGMRVNLDVGTVPRPDATGRPTLRALVNFKDLSLGATHGTTCGHRRRLAAELVLGCSPPRHLAGRATARWPSMAIVRSSGSGTAPTARPVQRVVELQRSKALHNR